MLSNSSSTTFSRSIEYFQGSQRPFALRLFGRRVYIVTSLRDIQEVYKATASLPFDDVARDFILYMGGSEEGLRIFYETPYQNNQPTSRHHSVLAHAGHDQLRQLLLPGKQLDALWLKVQTLIFGNLEWENIPHNDLGRPDGGQRSLSLSFWTTESLFGALATAFFGPYLLGLEPNLAQLYSQFEDESWKLNYKVPRIFARHLYATRDKIGATFRRYEAAPKDHKPGVSSIIELWEREMKDAHMPSQDITAFFAMMVFAFTVNPGKLCLWIMRHILDDPQLYLPVSHEIREKISSEQAFREPGIEIQLEKCERLVSVYNECLRFYTSSFTVRNVQRTTKIGDVVLDAGATLICPYRQLHLNEQNFGDDAKSFNPDRFLVHEGLDKSRFFRPFGGGTTHCSGQHLARRQVLIFVALALYRYDLQVVRPLSGVEDSRAASRKDGEEEDLADGSIGRARGTLPACNTKKVRSGVLPPLGDHETRVILSQRIKL